MRFLSAKFNRGAIKSTIVGGLFLFFYQNCTDVRLIPGAEEMQSKGSLCVAPPKQTVWSKVVFIVDKSGSNTNSDPGDVRRADNIEAFFNKVLTGQKPDFYKWAYILFGVETNKARSIINDGEGYPIFGDHAAMRQAIADHRATPDNGCTPYLPALEIAKQAIERDLREHPEEESIYNIFFMSDGFPNDAINVPGCASIRSVENNPNDPYISKVRDLVSLSPDKIFLSTAYYNPPNLDPDRRAALGLSYMAAAGGGKFVDLQASDKLDFDEIRVGERPESSMMKRLVVYNINSAFCLDGTVGVDSDGDGLCDIDEFDLNKKYAARMPEGKKLDPQNRNSISPDYSDFFIYKFLVLPTGSGLADCNNREADEDFDLFNSCEELALKDNQANGPTPQWTQEMREHGGFSADKKNPDSDGDGFIDFMEFFQFNIVSTAVDYTSITDLYLGGVTAETLMLQHRHPMRPEVFANTSYDIDVRYIGLDMDGASCYDVDVKQLPLYKTLPVTQAQASDIPYLAHGANENVIMVYFMTTPERDANGRGTLFYSHQNLDSDGSKQLEINNDVFKFYKVPRVY